MRASRLRLNPAKTQVMWLRSPQQLRQVDITCIQALSTKINVIESARNLGVTIDRQLSLSTHVAALCRSGYFQLRQLRPAVRSLTTEAAKTLTLCCLTGGLRTQEPPLYFSRIFFCFQNYALRFYVFLNRWKMHILLQTALPGSPRSRVVSHGKTQ